HPAAQGVFVTLALGDFDGKAKRTDQIAEQERLPHPAAYLGKGRDATRPLLLHPPVDPDGGGDEVRVRLERHICTMPVAALRNSDARAKPRLGRSHVIGMKAGASGRTAGLAAI